MATRNELCLKEKMNLTKEKENVLSRRSLSDKFSISIRAVSNISKKKLRIHKCLTIAENKKIKIKFKAKSNQDIKTKIHFRIFSIRT